MQIFIQSLCCISHKLNTYFLGKFIIKLLYSWTLMSRLKVRQQFVYFPKNIRKNINRQSRLQSPQQSIQRPKTTPQRYFASKGYRINLYQKHEKQQSALTTLQVNNLVYKKDSQSPERKNARSFLESCRIDKFKENKIKYSTIEGKFDLDDQNNQMESFVTALIDSNYFFQRLERTMAESLSLIGKQKKYEKGQKIELKKKSIGFVLYGKIKLYGKDFVFVAGRGDTIGQHELFGYNKQLKMKFMDESAILWVTIPNYNILRQQTVKQGFRHDFNKIQTQLRLSYIKKKMPKQ